MRPANPPTVAVRRCESYSPEKVYDAVCRQFEMLGGTGCFIGKNQRVLIKPNLIVPCSPDIPAQTHPEVIYAVAKLVREAGAIPLVGDSPAWSNTQGCLKALQIDHRLSVLGAKIVQLNQPVQTRIDGISVGISRIALEADVIINLPKLKAHQQLGATFAIKNIYGCVAGFAGKEKAWWHFARGGDAEAFCRIIIGVFRRLNPVLTLIDGIVAMEGQGPINGTPCRVGYLIAGRDPVACERICCEMVGIDPKTLPLLQTARKMGFGCALEDPIEIKGDTFNRPVCPDFKPAVQTPLRFTLPRICKSIAVQGWLLLKNKMTRRLGG
ncbi:MAG: DUF362 domain-containing protein [Planctomycetales bacterium]|nr:DUF362 domain-containing protein [Planctomycetales bacterium]